MSTTLLPALNDPSRPRPTFLGLPGEIQAMIRESIVDLPWTEDEIGGIRTHEALWEATRHSAIVYDERFWKRLAFQLGIGGFDDCTEGHWHEDVRKIRQYASEKTGSESDVPLHVLNQWIKDRKVIHPPKIDFEFNPLLMALYLNWWKAPTTSVQPPPVAQAFFICPGDVPKPEDNDVPPPVPSLASAAKHVSLYSFATSPPVSQIRIVFDVSGTEAGSNEEWVRETPAHIERLDGVRVIDIIRGMYSWLQTPLTSQQKRVAIEQSRIRNPGIFSRLEASTDEDTLHLWLSKMFGKRLSLIQGRYGGLRPGDDLNSATVILIPRDDHLEALSTALMSRE